MEDETFFVGIRNPKEFRRELLGNIKSILATLKRFEDFKTLREQKAKGIIRMRKVVNELQYLVNRLDEVLPETKLRAVGVKKKAAKKDSKDLVELEKEITQVEGRIEAL